MGNQPQNPEFRNNPEKFHPSSSKNDGKVNFGSN